MKLFTISMPEDAGSKYKQFSYPAGEVQVRLNPGILADLAAVDAVHVVFRGTNVMALAQLTDAIYPNLTPSSDLILFLPYLPYGRADRRFTEGDSFGLHVFGKIIDGLGYSKIVTLDAHNPVAAKRSIANLIDVSPRPLIQQVAETIGLEGMAILLPDEGAEKRYISGLCYSSPIGVPVLTGSKKRDPATGKLSGFDVPNVSGFKKVLIVDDICDGGGTFAGISDVIVEEHGNVLTNLFLYTTHSMYSKGASGLSRFQHLYTTDSFNSPLAGSYQKGKNCITRMPVGGLLRAAVMSTSELYAAARDKK